MDFVFYLIQYGHLTRRYWSSGQAKLAFVELRNKMETLPPAERPRLRLKKCLMTKDFTGKYKVHTTALFDCNFNTEGENGIR